jgi:hypothetical protein
MTSDTIASRLWPRYLAIGMGIFILFWLPIEDRNERVAILIALGICTISLIQILISRPVISYKNILFHALTGGLAGAATTPMAILLITIKSGLHDHGFPEFAMRQIANIFNTTPYFLAGGLLIALSSAVWRFARIGPPT